MWTDRKARPVTFWSRGVDVRLDMGRFEDS